MKLHYWENQLILYTKGHFGKIDYDREIKYFPANLYGLYLEHTDDYNVLGMIVRLYQKLVDHKLIPFELEGFIDGIFRKSRMYRGKSDEVNRQDIMDYMLAAMQNMQVQGTILELGEPDKEMIETLTALREGMEGELANE